MIIKSHFHNKGFALGLILKQRLGTSRKWPIKPNLRHFKIILEKKYETEKYITCNSNKIDLFDKKWKMFKGLF